MVADDGNAHPETATCSTVAVMSCTGASGCNQWYSDLAADQIRGSCVGLDRVVREEPCPEQYDRCCISTNASNDLPEGICRSPFDEGYAAVGGACAGISESIYCGD
jgi:hypothetical protein